MTQAGVDTIDSRFTSATDWQISEGQIMEENGVYDRLYNQEYSSASHGSGILPIGGAMDYIDRTVSLMRSSFETRKSNM